MRWPRRALLLALANVVVPRAAAGERAPAVVTLFGDSIVAGYGLSPAEGLASQLGLALQDLGLPMVVRNAGVPGDTSPRGLARVGGAVRKDTAVCVVEFGGNDRRLGYPDALTRESLDAIVRRLKARGMSVVMVGFGSTGVQSEVAEANGVLLYPDLFAGVGPALRQPDGIHPDAAGARVIARGLAPLVAEWLQRRPAGGGRLPSFRVERPKHARRERGAHQPRANRGPL